MRKILILIAGCIGLAGFLMAPQQAAAHPGNDPHVPDSYFSSYNFFTIQASGIGGVGSGWKLGVTANYIEDEIEKPNGGANFPDVIFNDCDNTSGPCVHVHDHCFSDPDTYGFDRNVHGPIEGEIVLNRCWGPHGASDPGRDQSITCRVLMRYFGMHLHTGTGCTSNPWSLAANLPSQNALDTMEFAYNNNTGCQLPCGGPGNGRVGEENEGAQVDGGLPDSGTAEN